MKLKELKEELKETQKGNNIDDVVDTYVFEPLGLLFAKLFIKLRMKPNAVTIISAIIGIIGGLLLSQTRLYIRLIGIGLILISAIFDCSDGIVARKTKQFSPIGRTLDGFCDGLIYAAIYIGVGIRLMDSYMLFFRVKWGIWIWPVLALVGYFHARQMKMVDYIRNLHLKFVDTEKRHELDRSNCIVVEGNFITKLFKKFYKGYTRSQERLMPITQELLCKTEAKEDISEVNKVYKEESRKVIKVGNMLTYNTRTITLFILTLLGYDSLIILFNIIVLEPVLIFLLGRYEKIAKQALDNINQ